LRFATNSEGDAGGLPMQFIFKLGVAILSGAAIAAAAAEALPVLHN
jgi:hypothetical protein